MTDAECVLDWIDNEPESKPPYDAIRAVLAADRAGRDKDAEQPDRVSFWYMFDNHTFQRLSGTLDEMVATARKLERYGMLCPPILCCGEKEIRRVGKPVHNAPHHDWDADTAKWKAACKADADVMRLLDAATGAQG